MEPNLAAIGTMLSQRLSSDHLESLARQTGFLRRHRKVTPLAWLQECCGTVSMGVISMRLCAISLGWLSRQVISKQALAKRLTSASAAFVKAVMLQEFQRQSRLGRAQSQGVFSGFNRVLPGDSTVCALSPKLAGHFPGASNQNRAATAAAKLQAVWELCSEKLVGVGMTSYRVNDQKASARIVGMLQERDLVLRDLGYWSVAVFAAILGRGAFFLSRYRCGVSLFDRQGSPLELLSLLQSSGSFDQTVEVGQKERLPLRLVARPVPQPVAAERRRKLRADRDKRRRPSKEQLALLGWEIFVTNVPPSVWSPRTVAEVYGIRWRIEILFKAFKSHCHFKTWPDGNTHWMETLMHARLLWVLLFQVSFSSLLLNRVANQPKREVSLLKLIQFAQQQSVWIQTQLREPGGDKLLLEQLLRHCTYEKIKNRVNYQQVRQHFGLS